MALQDVKYGSGLAQSVGYVKGSAGSLKKQKSLSALFTSRSRKLPKSQSRPPSPPTPGTPKIPEQYLPRAAQNLHSQDGFNKRRNTEDGPSTKSQSMRRPQPRQPLNTEDLWVRSRNSSAEDPGHATQASHQSGTENGPWNSNIDSDNQIISIDKPRMYHSPTFPQRKKSSHQILHQPAGRPEPRLRGFSATVKGVPTERKSDVVYERPATAGGSLSHYYGKNWFPESLDDQPRSPTRGSVSRSARRDLRDTEEARTSFRSAVTNNSSIVNAASTDRSSVATRCTSVSESTIDNLGSVPPKDSYMTADDAIDMYAAGFADETDSERTSSNLKDCSIDGVEQERSMKIVEAMNDQIGPEFLPPNGPSTSASRSSAAIMSGAAFAHDASGTPTILPPTSTRDQYGFSKASHYVSVNHYDAWHTSYSATQERRNGKWLSYLRDSRLSTYLPSRFPSRSNKTQRYIRKGIPPAWRGPAWFFYAGGDAHLQKNPNLYATLVARSSSELNNNDRDLIERDLHRTFPDNLHFKPNQIPTAESPLLISLRNVLRAFSLHCPRIGYCQSLNFIAGLLLLFLSEEKAFWMLHIITTTYLPGTHEISLEGANVDLWVLMTALKDFLPSIWTKISSGGDDEAGGLGAKLPPISLCTTSWFMSLFIGTLPIESVLRVWDVLFYEGSRTLFRVAIAIFKIGEQRIKAVNESMEMFQVVQGLPREMLDVSLLLTVAHKRGVVSQDWVERRRLERKEWYAKERASVLGVNVAEEEGDRNGKLRRGESLWRRRK